MSMSPSWNSSQAEEYQRVVQPPGSHVPSQRVPNELTITVPIMREEVEDEETDERPRWPRPKLRAACVVSRIIDASPSRRDRAAVEQARAMPASRRR